MAVVAGLALALAAAGCDSKAASTATDAAASSADTTAAADATTAKDVAASDTTAATDVPAAGKDTSTTGGGALTWTAATSGTSQTLSGIAWSGKTFVVSVKSSFLTSPDGLTWTMQKTSESMNWLGAIAWGGNTFAALGGWGGDTGVFTSPDGIKWTDHFKTGTGQAVGIVWAGNQFVTSGALTSPDGATWTAKGKAAFSDVAWNGKLLVGVGGSCSIFTSPDAVAWTETQCQPGRTNKLTGVTWTGKQWVAVGGKGIALTSPDGVKWEDRTWDTNYELADVAGNEDIIVIVGAHTYPGMVSTVMTLSPDGKTWNKDDTLGGTGLNAVIWSGSKFVAVGNDGLIVSTK